MLICTSIEKVPPLEKPCGLTIGSFDGMHPGHHTLLQALRTRIGDEALLTVLTFNNHPTDVIPSKPKTPLLCSIEYKLELLSRAGVDLVIALDFTKEFSEQPYDLFLTYLKNHLPFSHLVLGKGASFGKDREGNDLNVTRLSHKLGFKASYLEKLKNGDLEFSSGKIREAVIKGDLKQARELLGRPYALYGRLQEGILNTKGLCLPPSGRYPLLIVSGQTKAPGTAYIEDQVSIDCEVNFFNQPLEAIFI